MTRWNADLPPAEYVQGQGPPPPPNGKTLAIEGLVRAMKDQPIIAIDTETTGLSNWNDYPLYASVAWAGRRIAMHASVLPWLKEVLFDPNVLWVLANAKFDMHMLANFGTPIKGRVHCIQVMHAQLFAEVSHKLKDMARQLLGYTWKDFQDTFGRISAKKGISAEDVIRRAEKEDMALLIEYACMDALGTWELYLILKKMLQKALTYSLYYDRYPYIETLWDYFAKIEAPYTRVLWGMERLGVKVDLDITHEISPKVEKDIDQLQKEINKEAGTLLNVKSHPQLRKVLFDPVEEGGLGLTPVKLTSGGKSGVRLPSTDGDVLEKLTEKHRLPSLILQHRDLVKLHGTYLTNIDRFADPNGRIHTTYTQDIARTGRLTSKDPNLQNIPNPENDKWVIRRVFIAEDGYVLIVIDYKQLEMRLLACASGDEKMLEVFRRNWDIHMGNASMMYGYPYEDFVEAKRIDKLIKSGQLGPEAKTEYIARCLQYRYEVKSTGFGLNYGMGVTKLALQLGISKAEATLKREKYLNTYPAVSRFYDSAKAETKRTGYAYTVLGRRRALPEILSRDGTLRSSAERKAVNTRIQGSAADVVKMAQLQCALANLEYRFGCRMIMQIHDELVFECPVETAQEAMDDIVGWMEHPFPTDLAIPLSVDAGMGHSWAEGH